MIKNKKIFIFGGSGSLGNELVKRYIHDNEIICYSRDEWKHWKMGLEYNSEKIKFIIGDIGNYDRVCISLIRENPDYIIMAAAMKHIDRCEYAFNECNNVNTVGTVNVLNCIENHRPELSNLTTVCFISTDKACSPVNVYGLCKALSEKLMIERSLFVKDIKFVCVRYGNVLNSRGSIIPILHAQGQDSKVKNYMITDDRMTRFVMTLEQSVNLIEYAILNGNSGDVVIPKLTSMMVKDLIEIFSEKYNKPIQTGKLRPGEKMLESLINETESLRVVKSDDYYLIRPSYLGTIFSDNIMDFNSKINPLSKNELKIYLENLNLI